MNFSEILGSNFRGQTEGGVPIDYLGGDARQTLHDVCQVLDQLQESGQLQLNEGVTPEELLRAVAEQMQQRRAEQAVDSTQVLFPGELVPGV